MDSYPTTAHLKLYFEVFLFKEPITSSAVLAVFSLERGADTFRPLLALSCCYYRLGLG